MKINEYRIINDEMMHPQLEIIKEWEYTDKTDTPILLNDLYHMNKCAEEYLYVVAKNFVGDILGIYQLSHGTYKASHAGNKELYTFLLLVGAEIFEIAHNHPNGNLKSSDNDITVTNNMKQLSNILDITFNEHFIISKNGFSKLIHEECDNELLLWDGFCCVSSKYNVCDSLIREIKTTIEIISNKENRDLCNCNELEFNDNHYIITDEEYTMIENILDKNINEGCVLLCREG